MIVVTAPTSSIGRQLLDHLLGEPGGTPGEAVRVIARDPSRLPERVREQAEVVQGSHSEAAVVDKAFAGAQTVFWLVPADPTAPSVDEAYSGFARAGLRAFAEQGVERVVGISSVGRGLTVPAGNITATLAMDDAIARTGVAYRALTMPTFMDNLLRQAAAIRDRGVISVPMAGDRKLPTVATRDIAAVAARLLLDHTWTGVAEVPVLGPEDLSFEDMARIAGEVLGRPVRFERTPDEAFRARLLGFGASEAMADAALEMFRAAELGPDTPRTPGATMPTTFRQWCEEVLAPAVRG